MKNLSLGADTAWRIAAHEAAASGYRFSEEAALFLAQKGVSPEYGARDLRRTVEKYVQMPLSNMILSGRFRVHNSWLAYLENGGILFQPEEEVKGL
ncbi:MAG: hypothetical protein HZB33_08055 [Nitrospirae bacterium]|nr:hypothetical protein [Nitrospirota bacterium]